MLFNLVGNMENGDKACDGYHKYKVPPPPLSLIHHQAH